MKRYILLLALISMQANVTLPIFEGLKSKVGTFIGSFNRINAVLPNGIWGNFKSNFKSSFTSKMSSMFGYFKFRTAQAQEAENKTVPAKIEESTLLNELEELEPGKLAEFFGNRMDTVVDKKNLDEEQLDGYNFVKNHCSKYLLNIFYGQHRFKRLVMEQGGKCVAIFAQEVNDRDEAYQKFMSGERGSLTYLFKNHVDKLRGMRCLIKNSPYMWTINGWKHI